MSSQSTATSCGYVWSDDELNALVAVWRESNQRRWDMHVKEFWIVFVASAVLYHAGELKRLLTLNNNVYIFCTCSYLDRSESAIFL